MARVRYNGLTLDHADVEMRGRPYNGRGGIWNVGDEREIEGYHAKALVSDFPGSFVLVDDAGIDEPAPVEESAPAPGLTVAQRAERKRNRGKGSGVAAAPVAEPEAAEPKG